MTGPVRPVLPLAGPLEEDPTNAVEFLAAEPSRILDGVQDRALAMARTMLASAVVDLERGAWDERVIEWLAGKDVSVIATVASLLRRAFEAGVAAGRSEVVEEQPLVQHLRREVSKLVAEVEEATEEVRGLEDELRAADAKTDRFRQALVDLAASAEDIDARLDADRLTSQGAYERLLGEVRDAVGGAR